MKKILVSALCSSILFLSCQKKEETTQQNEPEKPSQTQTSQPSTSPTSQAQPQTSDIGIGPIKKVEVGTSIDKEMAKKGEEIFKMKCSMCHKIDENYVGPALRGVTLARKPEWIMNMILNPIEMTQKDPAAKALYETYLTQMPHQNLSEQEARAVLEYLRSIDQQSK